jgi:hypothetical protein
MIRTQEIPENKDENSENLTRQRQETLMFLLREERVLFTYA